MHQALLYSLKFRVLLVRATTEIFIDYCINLSYIRHSVYNDYLRRYFMRQINLAKAKSNLSEFASRAAYNGEHIVITKEVNNLLLSYLSKTWDSSKKFRPDLLKTACLEPFTWRRSLKKLQKKPWRHIREELVIMVER